MLAKNIDELDFFKRENELLKRDNELLKKENALPSIKNLSLYQGFFKKKLRLCQDFMKADSMKA